MSPTFWRGATRPRGPNRVQRLKQKERAFQRQIVELAHLRGWAAYHTWRSDHSEVGWPDLVLCKPPRLVFAEVKTETGIVAPAQEQWLAALRACGCDARVWRPADWHEIDATLA